MMYYLKNPFIFAAWKTKNYRNMLQSLKNQAIFANPMTLRFSMETITLSYEPGSDFAVALEELIRNSEGVRVEKRSVDAKAVLEKIQDLFVDDKGWRSEEEMLEDLARFRQERNAECAY